MKLKLKLDDEGKVVLQDGMPIYVHEDGKEIPFDAGKAFEKIEELNTENSARRHANKELTDKLSAFLNEDGEPLDPEEVQKALKIVKNLEDKQMLDAEGVEKLKAQIQAAYVEKENETRKGYDAKIEAMEKEIGKRDSTIYDFLVREKFLKSPTILEKTVIPPDMAADYWGKHFAVEGQGREAKVIGRLNGDKILSRKNPGHEADFEEALETIIDNYPMKAAIMRSTAGGAGGGGSDSQKVSDAEKQKRLAELPPSERLKQIYRDQRKAAES
jgi:hypothetical protein